MTNDSPCIALCSTALGDSVCRGCARTFVEVANWCALTPQQKITIRAELPERHRWLKLAHAVGGMLDICEEEGQPRGMIKLFDAEPIKVAVRDGRWQVWQGEQYWELDEGELPAILPALRGAK